MFITGNYTDRYKMHFLFYINDKQIIESCIHRMRCILHHSFDENNIKKEAKEINLRLISKLNKFFLHPFVIYMLGFSVAYLPRVVIIKTSLFCFASLNKRYLLVVDNVFFFLLNLFSASTSETCEIL